AGGSRRACGWGAGGGGGVPPPRRQHGGRGGGREPPLPEGGGHVGRGGGARHDLSGRGFLERQERVVRGRRRAVLADMLRHRGERRHERIGFGEQRVLQAQRVHVPHRLGDRRREHGAHGRLQECAIERE